MGNINTFTRHQGRREWCPYCHAKLQPSNSSIDHIHPQSAGGPKIWFNETGTCRNCNGDKADTTVLEFLLRGRSAKGHRMIEPRVVIPLDELSIMPHQWADPLSTLGFIRSGSRGTSDPRYAGLGSKQRKVLRAKQ